MILRIQMSLAYDNDMQRNPKKDDWIIEDIGDVPPEVLDSFIKNRYPKAISVWIKYDNKLP